jgi:uncharacterized protein (TIGR03437 family)
VGGLRILATVNAVDGSYFSFVICEAQSLTSTSVTCPALTMKFGVPTTLGVDFEAGTNLFDFLPGSVANLDYTAVLNGIAITDPANQNQPVAFAVASASGAQYTASGAAVGPPPAISTGGIISADAFGAFTAAAPGSWIEIYGTNLAADSRSWTGADFNGNDAPTLLDGTSVTVGGQPAFVDYISPGQVNAQVPSNTSGGSQRVIVTTVAGESAALTVTVNAEEPGLLAPPSFDINGTQYVVALFPDGTTYVLPPSSISGVTSRRAQPGDVITLYGVGFGSVTPSTPAGQTVQELNTLAAPFQILLGQVEATLQYDGLAPGAVGLYQFNLVVPNVTASDAVPVTFTLAGVEGTQTLYIAVQN